jgi:Family of unknown function (DUF6167)
VSRALWFAAGAATGAYALVKARRTAQSLTPDGIAARVAALRVGLRFFADEVSYGMAEKEAELRNQLRLTATPDDRRGIERSPREPTPHLPGQREPEERQPEQGHPSTAAEDHGDGHS